MVVVALLLIVVLALLVRRWYRIGRNRWKGIPPGTFGLPVVGETLNYASNFAGQMANLHRRGMQDDNSTRLYSTHFLGKYTIDGWSAKFARTLSAWEKEGKVEIRLPSMSRKLLGPIVDLSAAHQNRIHKAVERAFSSKVMAQTFHQVRRTTRTTLDAWVATGVQENNVGPLLRQYITQVILNILLGRPIALERVVEYERLLTLFEEGLFAVPLDMPGTTFRRSMESKAKLMQMFSDDWSQLDSESDNEYFLSNLVAEDVEFLDRSDVLHLLVRLLGYANSFSAGPLSAALRAFGTQEPVRNNMRAAAKELGIRIDALDYRSLCRNNYFDAFARECLRCLAGMPMVHREARQNLEYEGYFIPKGWTVGFNIYLANQSQNLWDDPAGFDPNRFLQSGLSPRTWSTSSAGGCPFSMAGTQGFHPFGIGEHQCPSQNMAMFMIKIFSYILARDYEIDLWNPFLPNGLIGLRFEMCFRLRRRAIDRPRANSPVDFQRFQANMGRKVSPIYDTSRLRMIIEGSMDSQSIDYDDW
mmetsp:Transcript_10980/g.26531  ORF Transcript_10980/g.26531 Transcript_10980/m.26531 type:complete len:529 (-) Transcript_10980:59-1645(-)